jgi:hypothetical protein
MRNQTVAATGQHTASTESAGAGWVPCTLRDPMHIPQDKGDAIAGNLLQQPPPGCAACAPRAVLAPLCCETSPAASCMQQSVTVCICQSKQADGHAMCMHISGECSKGSPRLEQGQVCRVKRAGMWGSYAVAMCSIQSSKHWVQWRMLGSTEVWCR